MGCLSDDRLIYEILSVVEGIPKGRVATYGQIARLIGRDRNARLVGTVLSRADYYGRYPCHRVVNHAGRLVPGWGQQVELLRQEGVVLKDACHVDLKAYQWMFENTVVMLMCGVGLCLLRFFCIQKSPFSNLSLKKDFECDTKAVLGQTILFNRGSVVPFCSGKPF